MSTPGFAAVAQEHPQLWQEYTAYVDAVWSSDHLPAGTLELCRLRMAQLLGVASAIEVRLARTDEPFEAKARRLAQWPTDPLFSATDRACLAFAEQFLFDAQALDERCCAAVVEAVGDSGLVTLALGVGLAEGMTRGEGVLAGPSVPS